MNADILELPKKEYNIAKRRLEKMAKMKLGDNPHAFHVMYGDKHMIIYNQDSNFDKDMKEIVIQHEMAHARGVKGEEDADREALKKLNKKRQDILKSYWKARHGHDYE